MRIFCASTSTNNVDVVLASLKFLLDPTRAHTEPFTELEVFRYDEKYNIEARRAVQGNPEMMARLQAGLLHFPPERVGMDREMLEAARDFKPDIVLFIGAWAGDFCPRDETLAELNTIAPSVHILFDAQDPPWWTDCGPAHGNIVRWHARDCFKLTVCLDGADNWPGHPNWPDKASAIGPALTSLTPMDPRFFMGPPAEVPYRERPYVISYAGNRGGYIRGTIVDRMSVAFSPKGLLAVKLRDDGANSYKGYADFLRMSRIVVNVPFTGSGASKHVKGRVVEAGYAGCALLEWKNTATRQFLIPRYEYMEYETVEELIDLSEWMAHHPAFCAEMAYALRAKMVNEYSPLKFWSAVFGGVGLEMFKPGIAMVQVTPPPEPAPAAVVSVPKARSKKKSARRADPPAASNGEAAD